MDFQVQALPAKSLCGIFTNIIPTLPRLGQTGVDYGLPIKRFMMPQDYGQGRSHSRISVDSPSPVPPERLQHPDDPHGPPCLGRQAHAGVP